MYPAGQIYVDGVTIGLGVGVILGLLQMNPAGQTSEVIVLVGNGGGVVLETVRQP
jgi:hypothetical protein